MRYALKFTLFFALFFILVQTGVYSQTRTKTSESQCANLSKIESFPFLPSVQKESDKNFRTFMGYGEKAIPCLIENITNTKKTKDPTCPSFGNVLVGDVAFFILLKIGNLKFEQMLPKEIHGEIKSFGKFAYYSHISEDKNRAKLQTRLKRWYSSKKLSKK